MTKIPKRGPLLFSSNTIISTWLHIYLPKKRNMTTYNKLKQTSKTFSKKNNNNNNPHARWTHVQKLYLNEINILSFKKKKKKEDKMNELNQNKISIFLSLQPSFYCFFSFLPLVMEAVDSWVMADSLFLLCSYLSLFLSLIVLLHFVSISKVVGYQTLQTRR